MSAPEYTPKLDLSSRNCGSLTTYEIRQELVHRDALDIPDKEINHRSMLKRLVEELVKCEQINYEATQEMEAKKREDDMAARKAEREKKKAEALERSRARQADKEYFKKKAEMGQEAEMILKEVRERTDIEVVKEGEDQQDDADDDDDDPFRTYKPKKGQKVYVK